MIVLLVAVGALIGAPLRYLTDRAVQSAHRSRLPWGTLCVNIAASLVLGVVAGGAAHVPVDVAAVIGTGFCGSLSTFSTFSFETVRLAQARAYLPSVANAAISLLAGLGAATLGYAIGATLR